ncbi:MAG: tRNA (N(6)-L-threonylcarbamoyladenosine(37)-C(2))-methylthiotransferase MtaB [Candidatus Omnitrophica bacterium]|nr:tRNA (N(6)-L-threonylcarbamoyladenosine(37)-C(2))-methylthiotransferase MtaB [Candidatus Omnitrophota bacterium]
MKKPNRPIQLKSNCERGRTVKFYTVGCKVNQYETQSIKEQFAKRGFQEAEDNRPCDIYLVNTCTVTHKADRDSRRFIHKAIRDNPESLVIVTGCYVELDGDKIAKIPGVAHVVKNKDKHRITGLLSNDNQDNELGETGITGFREHSRAFLKIQDGCDNRCSYCRVPLARGASRSRPLNDIRREAKILAENGFKEIVLAGICLGTYGRDLKPQVNLVDAIEAIENIEELRRIRLSSIEAGNISDRLINKMAQSKKLCRHLHIPIQSGDDAILARMNRRYSRAGYLDLINKIKSAISGIAITTDIIVGFPGEKEENFQNTISLIKEILPLRVHIFPYSPRPNTTAVNLKDRVNLDTIKNRVLALQDAANNCSQAYMEQFLGQDMDVLVEERLKESSKFWQGHTHNYIKVRIESSQALKNLIITARLKKISGDSMLADSC